MANESLKQFVKDLLIASKLVEEGADFDEDYVEKMTTEVEKYIGLEIMKLLDDKALAEYAKLLESGKELNNPEKIGEFLNEHIPDFTQKQQDILKTYAERFHKRTETMKQSL